ncbi:hypothetical protein INT47_000897 [Mucor saturninus]|uniref:Uncharacterized protein n=1 Tax=Mucor saturninus TaxID=64648 RepID=A0A8H7V8R2_9FUNG|nr:hypothetical protein INT47_000897 [Mucor saturninus]
MEHKPQLKRTRSTEAMDRNVKRPKAYEEAKSTPPANTEAILYPTALPTHTPLLKPISISTRTHTPATGYTTTHAPVMSYEGINGLLHSVHIERFGDPDTRLQDEEMTDTLVDNQEYNNMNSVLRQAFLQRH